MAKEFRDLSSKAQNAIVDCVLGHPDTNLPGSIKDEIADWATRPAEVVDVYECVEEFEADYDDMEPPRCLRCDGEGQVPTMDHESYFGAQMKPCPLCHGVLDGLGHGRLS